MFIHNKKGRIIAQVRFAVGSGSETACGNSTTASLLSMLKEIPRQFLRADIRYFGLGHDYFVPLTTYQGHQNMDIQSALNDAETEQAGNAAADEKFSKMIFVCPSSERSPDDGVLLYSSIESIFDIDKVPDRTVVLFRPEQVDMLKLLCDNQTMFDIEVRSLTGVPETDYSAEFDSATWAVDRVSYLPFLSELRLAAEIDTQLAATQLTDYDREKQSYTRKSGEVKQHVKFDVAVPEGEGVDADDVEVS